jgi:hypothetical protein
MKIIGYIILAICSIFLNHIFIRAKISFGYAWLIQIVLFISFILIFNEQLLIN